MQKIIKRIILVQISIFILNACAQFEDEQKQNSQIQTEKKVSAKDFSEQIQIQVTPLIEPEKYNVSFVWPKLEAGSRVRITLNKTVVMIESDQTGFKQDVAHNQSALYFFEILDQKNNLIKTFSKNIIIPRDFVVREGQSEFFEKTELNVNRFFLNHDIPITTNGNEVTINANELISDDAIIQTYIEKNKAAPSSNGKNGGKITINAKNAVGKLEIFMRGEHGGNGLDGGEYSESRAASGRDAALGVEECENVCVGPRCPMAKVCTCLSIGKNSGNGVDGLNGKNGGNAGNGGSTGILLVNIQSGKDFQIKVIKEKGLSGFAGKKGIGQLGGFAGKGNFGKCSGKPGSNGADGLPGIDGLEGIDGVEENVCLHIESEQRNECF